MTKTYPQINRQIHRIEMMMLNKNFYPKNHKRYRKWIILADTIQKNMLKYLGGEYFWEDAVYARENEPIPYEVRTISYKGAC